MRLRDYTRYVRDNPHGYWFKRKLYGWGWTPVTWQGWAVTLLAIGLIVLNAFRLDTPEASPDVVFTFVLQTFLIVSILIGICYKTGESPKWQWGPPKKEE